MPNQTRGLRNNNPGNIRHGEQWQGLAASQSDTDFCTFSSAEYGIRAMGKILLNYDRKYGLRTVSKIIDRWAPPNENNTYAYIAHVAQVLNVDPDEAIDLTNHETLKLLIGAIIKHENGYNPYDDATLLKGIQLCF